LEEAGGGRRVELNDEAAPFGVDGGDFECEVVVAGLL
jgi:hypothetical protein